MIKKLLTSTALCVIFFGSAQQLTNSGFENWTSGNPDGWGSFDEMLTNLGLPGSTLETQVSPGNSGTSACQLKTQNIPLVGDFPGVINSGSISLGAQVDFGLSPYTGMPTDYTFTYKFSPVSGDTAGTQVIFTKWNTATNMRDTIGYGGDYIVGAASSFTLRSIPITWIVPGTAPDSVSMIFVSSVGAIAQVNTTLTIDDVNMVLPLGITEPFMFNEVIAFPNPATDVVNFSSKNQETSSVEIFDFSGKRVAEANFQNGKVSFNTTELLNGVYMYRISDSEGSELKVGKFSVSK